MTKSELKERAETSNANVKEGREKSLQQIRQESKEWQ